jgi:hypothetical protein
MRAGFIAVAASSGSGPGAPGVVTGVVGTSGNTQVSLSWSAPVSNGGSAITNYAVQHSSNSGSTWSTAVLVGSASTTYAVTSLSNGTSYIFRVAAINTIGTGPYSTASSTVTPATVPDAPTGVSATSNANQQSVVSWTPGAANGATISDYTVQFSSNDGSSWSTFTDGVSAATSATVTGLVGGTTYVFRVSATNAAGTGSYSTMSAGAVPAAVPGAPGAPALTAGDSTDTFTWTAAAANGSTVTGYRYQVSNDNGANWYSTIGGTLNSFTATTSLSVALSTQYRTDSWKLRVSAVNGVGVGPYTSISTSGTGVWALPAATQTSSCTCTQACSCGACNCGTNIGSQTATGSQTRSCFRWTRTGSTTSGFVNSDGVTACNSAYTACGSCGTYGTCGSCPGCSGTETLQTTTGEYNGTTYYAFTDVNGANYMSVSNPQTYGCAFCYDPAWYIYKCNLTNAFRIVYRGCVQYTDLKC